MSTMLFFMSSRTGLSNVSRRTGRARGESKKGLTSGCSSGGAAYSLRPLRILTVLTVLLALLPAGPSSAAAQGPVVHAILFYSPACPHCHQVINEVLPPLRERFGNQFVVVGVDVTTEGGQALYRATVDHFAVPESRLGVPNMVVGTNVMVGSLEIPELLPGIIERGLATGGIDWPPVDAVWSECRGASIGPSLMDLAGVRCPGGMLLTPGRLCFLTYASVSPYQQVTVTTGYAQRA